jgi:hypothetical protein
MGNVPASAPVDAQSLLLLNSVFTSHGSERIDTKIKHRKRKGDCLVLDILQPISMPPRYPEQPSETDCIQLIYTPADHPGIGNAIAESSLQPYE